MRGALGRLPLADLRALLRGLGAPARGMERVQAERATPPAATALAVPPAHVVGAALLGRLVVDSRYAGQGAGAHLHLRTVLLGPL